MRTATTGSSRTRAARIDAVAFAQSTAGYSLSDVRPLQAREKVATVLGDFVGLPGDVAAFARRVEAAGGSDRRDISDALGIPRDAAIKEYEAVDGVLFDLGGPGVW